MIAVGAASIALLSGAPRAHADGVFTRGPYPQDLGSRSVAILFGLAEPHRATLEVSRAGAVLIAPSATSASAAPSTSTAPKGAPSASASVAESAAKTAVSASSDSRHELVVSGLEPATTYRYSVKLDDGRTEGGTFTTAPEDDRPLSFAMYGDNRGGHEAHAAVVRAMAATSPEFLIQTGDMVYDGSAPDDWAHFFAIEHDLLRDHCMFPALGNHELGVPGSDGVRRFADYFRLPAPPGSAERYYTFRWGNVRFFMVDSQNDFIGDERTWLENALTAADAEAGLTWRFVVLHHGPFSSGAHGPSAALVAERVPALLARHRVDLIVSGHDHIYERGVGGGLRYVITGGGGAPLYREFHERGTSQKFEPVNHFLRFSTSAREAKYTALRVDGSTIETCGFAANDQAAGWRCDGALLAPAAAMPSCAAGTPSGATSVSATLTGKATLTTGAPAKSSCACAVDGTGAVDFAADVRGAVCAALACVTASSRRRRQRDSLRA